jgi:iron complex transport system substrate-binding protein
MNATGVARSQRLILAATLALALPAHAAEPITVHDAFNRSVTLPAPPQRIVPIFASNTEIVASLGLADRIVGIESFTRYPREVLDRPLVGGRLGFSVDVLVALKPDLVVVTPSRQAANQLIDPMERLGVPIVVFLQRSVPEILANIRLMGRIAGVPERGEEVAARYEARLAAVRRRVEGLKPPSTIMITGRLGNGLLLVAREGTYTGDAMAMAGARFALPGTATIAQVSPEAILNADPDVLLWAGNERDLKDLVARPGWADMRAVRTRRAHAVSRVELLIPGPRTIDGIEHLAAIFHPDAMKR